MSNRMNIAVGEKIFVEGGADFIAMARPLIADPELPSKAQQGRIDEIRSCVACNQGCLDRLLTHGCKRITLVEMSNSIGKDIGPITRWSVLAYLKQHNVKIMKGAKAISRTVCIMN
ncbi:hypothetical protein [Desulfitobacterium hafniense]|nr:hypothetical protein [Desulfitobacterium hafniense]